MTTITSFNSKNAAALQTAIVAALAGVEAEYGVKIAATGGSLDGTAFKAKFQISVVDPAAKAADEKRKFAQAAFLFDLVPDHYGTVVNLKGEDWALVGFETRRAKFPLRLRNVKTGKELLYTETVLIKIRAARPDLAKAAA